MDIFNNIYILTIILIVIIVYTIRPNWGKKYKSNWGNYYKPDWDKYNLQTID